MANESVDLQPQGQVEYAVRPDPDNQDSSSRVIEALQADKKRLGSEKQRLRRQKEVLERENRELRERVDAHEKAHERRLRHTYPMLAEERQRLVESINHQAMELESLVMLCNGVMKMSGLFTPAPKREEDGEEEEEEVEDEEDWFLMVKRGWKGKAGRVR